MFNLVTVSAIFLLITCGINANELGVWTPAGTTGVTCIHTFLLPGFRLVCTERPHTGYPTNPFTNGMISTEIDLLNGASPESLGPWTSKFTPRHIDTSAFCSGHAQMPNGSILVMGGDEYGLLSDGTHNIYPDGRKGRRIYNPCPADAQNCVGSWVTLPDMATRRWYPSMATLADGSQIIIGGSTSNLDYSRLNTTENNPTYEYYPSKAGQWPRTLPILAWAFPFMLYPMVFTMPSERVFLFVSNKTVIIDPKTDELSYTVPDMPVLDHLPWIYPYAPTMTVLPMTIKNNWEFKIQICGGSKASNTDASPMCWQINPENANPTWKKVDDLPNPRVMIDSIILPDGKILYVNGAGGGVSGGDAGIVQDAYNPVMTPNLFDPEAPAGKQFSVMAPATNYRLYHSGVILVESGHVITTGSEMDNYDDYWKYNKTNCPPYPILYSAQNNCTQPFNYNLERYAPPYLQIAEKSGRPVISSAPASITHKSTFAVQISSTVSDISRVTFIRYSTTTHQTNTDQRFIELRILYNTSNSIIVEAPSGPGIAPPGNWMLFVLDKNGIPSVAKTINLQLGAPVTASVPTGATTFSPAVGTTSTSKNNVLGQKQSLGGVIMTITFGVAVALALFIGSL